MGKKDLKEQRGNTHIDPLLYSQHYVDKDIPNALELEESPEVNTETRKSHLKRGQASRSGDGLAV